MVRIRTQADTQTNADIPAHPRRVIHFCLVTWLPKSLDGDLMARDGHQRFWKSLVLCLKP